MSSVAPTVERVTCRAWPSSCCHTPLHSADATHNQVASCAAVVQGNAEWLPRGEDERRPTPRRWRAVSRVLCVFVGCRRNGWVVKCVVCVVCSDLFPLTWSIQLVPIHLFTLRIGIATTTLDTQTRSVSLAARLSALGCGGAAVCRAFLISRAANASLHAERCYEMENGDRAPVPLFSHGSTVATTSANTPSTGVKLATSSTASIHTDADYTPLPWTGYFDNQHDITIPTTQDTFRLYTAGQHSQPHYCAHSCRRSVSVMTAMYYGFVLLTRDAQTIDYDDLRDTLISQTHPRLNPASTARLSHCLLPTAGTSVCISQPAVCVPAAARRRPVVSFLGVHCGASEATHQRRGTRSARPRRHTHQQ